ncbi:hypothetical protein An01g05420 [Aspergillus niger]|uniref:Uncharacterized protein n=2 Tax=Aspergillus niger TaxID=5061 RepID=A2Q8S8_ASPNC|nr:hypothetical protein An01g05420 [Aspergillus niger]CAK43711.1 hypothetical protein An01g05420 [Aspergillus niger]
MPLLLAATYSYHLSATVSVVLRTGKKPLGITKSQNHHAKELAPSQDSRKTLASDIGVNGPRGYSKDECEVYPNKIFWLLVCRLEEPVCEVKEH